MPRSIPHVYPCISKIAPTASGTIDLAYKGRAAIGENVTIEENARDQLAAFAVHIPKRQPRPWGAWLGIPASNLTGRLSELDALIATICP